MIDLNKIKERIVRLGRDNHTDPSEVLEEVEANWMKYPIEYNAALLRRKKSKKKDPTKKNRFFTGPLEKRLFIKLANVCNWSCAQGNAEEASDILCDLGFRSYSINPNRFRQKKESYKKTHAIPPFCTGTHVIKTISPQVTQNTLQQMNYQPSPDRTVFHRDSECTNSPTTPEPTTNQDSLELPLSPHYLSLQNEHDLPSNNSSQSSHESSFLVIIEQNNKNKSPFDDSESSFIY